MLQYIARSKCCLRGWTGKVFYFLITFNAPFVHGQDFSIKHKINDGITLLNLKTVDGITVLDAFANKSEYRFDDKVISIDECLLQTDDRRILALQSQQGVNIVRGFDHSDFNGQILVSAKVLIRDSITYCNKSYKRLGDQGGDEILLLSYDVKGNLVQDRVYKNQNTSSYSLRDVNITKDKILLSGGYLYEDFIMEGLILETFSRGQQEGYYVEVSIDDFSAVSGERLNGLNADRVVNVVQHSQGDHILVQTNSAEACFQNDCAVTGLRTSWRTKANGIVSRNEQGEVQSFEFVKHDSGTSTLYLKSKDDYTLAFGLFSWDTIDVFGNTLVGSDLDGGFITSIDQQLRSIEAKKIEATDQFLIVDALIVQDKIAVVGLYQDELYYEDVMIKKSQGDNPNSFLMILDSKTLDLEHCYNLFSQEGIIYGIGFIPDENSNLLHLNLRNAEALYIDQEVFGVEKGYENGALILEISDDVVSHLKNQKKESHLQITPNPTSDILLINSNQKIKFFDLISLNGCVIKSHKTSSGSNTIIDVSTLPNGIYMVQVGDGQSYFESKLFVKQ